MQSAVIEVDSDSEYNCSYEAGVNYQWSDTENDEQIWTWSGLIVMEMV